MYIFFYHKSLSVSILLITVIILSIFFTRRDKTQSNTYKRIRNSLINSVKSAKKERIYNPIIFSHLQKEREIYPPTNSRAPLCVSWKKLLFCFSRPQSLPGKEKSRIEKKISKEILHRIDIEKNRKAVWQSRNSKDNSATVKIYHGIEIPSLLNRSKKDPSAEIRAPYINAYQVQSRNLDGILKRFSLNSFNGVVFDVKNVEGWHSISFHSLPKAKTLPLHRDLEQLISLSRKYNLYTIARIVLFQDHNLARKQPELALKAKRQRSKKWLDPADPRVQEMITEMVYELALRGVDEVQLDYVRFPSSDEFPYPIQSPQKIKNTKEPQSIKSEIIASVLKKIRKKISQMPVNLSADTFGITAWFSPQDRESIGQDFLIMGKYLDIISPMLYPSHFSRGFAGFDNPADEAEYFLFHGVRKLKKLNPHRIIIRPWIQAFPYRVSKFNEKYINTQISAADKAGATGYLLWNAAGRYNLILQK